MAREHGRFGRLYIATASAGTASPLLYAASFSVNLQTDQAEVTAFGDTSKTFVTGLPDGTVSFSGFHDNGTGTTLVAAALDGVARKAYIYPGASNTKYFFGTFFVSNTVDVAVGDSVKMSGDLAPATSISFVDS